jgi:urea transport system permease protein
VRKRALWRVRGLVIVLATILFVSLAGTLPARADEFARHVSALGADSFAEKEQALVGLGRLGDERAVAVLTALQDGRLVKAPDGRVLIAGAAKPVDPATGNEVPDVRSDELDRVRVNNRLRGVIEGVLARLSLFSTDPAARLAAAQEAARHPSADEAALLERAIPVEKDPAIRAAMARALSAARLVAGTKQERLAAARSLGATTDPQIKNLLDEVRAAPDIEPELRQAVELALASIENRLQLVRVAANLFQGISLGSVLLLAAIGVAITFGVMGVINMAHGEMIMLGAYAAYVCQQFFRAFLPAAWIDAYLVAAVPMAFCLPGRSA